MTTHKSVKIESQDGVIATHHIRKEHIVQVNFLPLEKSSEEKRGKKQWADKG